MVEGAPLVAGEMELLAPVAACELAALELLAAEEAEALCGEPRTALRPDAADCEAACAAALMV